MKEVSGFWLCIVLVNAIAIADSQWEFRKIDRKIGSLRPVNREEKTDWTERTTRQGQKWKEWVVSVCLLVCRCSRQIDGITIVDSHRELTDRKLVLYAQSTAKKKQIELKELHARDESERSEWFLIVFFSLDNAITSRQWEFSNW